MTRPSSIRQLNYAVVFLLVGLSVIFIWVLTDGYRLFDADQKRLQNIKQAEIELHAIKLLETEAYFAYKVSYDHSKELYRKWTESQKQVDQIIYKHFFNKDQSPIFWLDEAWQNQLELRQGLIACSATSSCDKIFNGAWEYPPNELQSVFINSNIKHLYQFTEQNLASLSQFYVRFLQWSLPLDRLFEMSEHYKLHPHANLKDEIANLHLIIQHNGYYLDVDSDLMKEFPQLGQKLANIRQLYLKSMDASIFPILFPEKLSQNPQPATTEQQLLDENWQLLAFLQSLIAAKAEKLTSDRFTYISIQKTILAAIFIGSIFLIILFRKRALFPLRQNEAILQGAAIGIMQTDSKGVIKRVNQAMETIFGYPSQELMNQPLQMLMPTHSPDKHSSDLLQDCLNHNKELNGQKSDGHVFPIELTVSAIQRSSEKEFIVLVNDLTERNEAKRQTELRNKLLNALKDAIETFMAHPENQQEVWKHLLNALLDISESRYGFIGEVIYSDDNQRCLKIRAAYCQDAQSEPQSFRTESARNSDILCQSDSFIDELFQNQKGIIINDVQTPIEQNSPYKTTEIKRYMGVPIYQGKNLVGAYLIANRQSDYLPKMIDFLEPFQATCSVLMASIHQNESQKTLMHELEIARDDALHSKQLAEDAAQAKSIFLANMSHEIRTPMNAIIGMAYLALRTDLNQQQHDYIDKIHRSGQSLLHVINDILDFSKIEAGKLQIENIPMQLEHVIADSVQLLAETANKKGLELVVTYQPTESLGDGGQVLGDPYRLQQILNNLLSNAIKFTEEGFIRVDVNALPKHNHLDIQILVEDTGIGMSQQQLRNLFQEFTQADSSTTRKYEGTGLGLSICKRIIDLMGGVITVESTPQQGSRFTVSLQLPLAPQLSHPDFSSLRDKTALIVDDLQILRSSLKSQLQLFGIHTSNAGSVREAIAILETGNFDFILLDCVMPEESGDILLEHLTKHRPELLGKTLLISAYGTEILREICQKYALNSRLEKPILPSSLYEALLHIQQGKLPEHSASEDKQLRMNLNGVRVLLAEDNQINQQIALELMQSQGVEVTVANNGQEALDKLYEKGPGYFDLLFLDLQMPVKDGYQTAKEIRTKPEYDDFPIFAMTAHVLDQEKQQTNALGLNGHLDKPIDPDKLYQTLERFASQKTMSSSPEKPREKHQDKLPEIEGMNLKFALKMTAGNRELLDRLLEEYWENYHDLADELDMSKPPMTSQSLKELLILVHSFKGVSASLGADQLAEKAQAVEQLLKDDKHQSNTPLLNETIENLLSTHRDVFKALKQYVTGLQSAEEVQEPSKEPPPFSELDPFLISYDSQALKIWHTHKQDFKKHLGFSDYKKVDRDIENFEFDSARKILKQYFAKNE
ncbi:response regulator [Thiomicrorhabdus sp.]|uniref:response regulator n=1 Tax=Thiomicrorhabdus sp. TaxID=2039724 RepID=UPI0029C6C8C7|nr:response regulator [Thiomicrorhabdus sp.]